MTDPRTKKLKALKQRIEVIKPKLPSYTGPEWVFVFTLCEVLEELIDMAIRKEL